MVTETDGKILNKIKQWQKESGNLPPILILYSQLFNAQLDIRSQLPEVEAGLSMSVRVPQLDRGIPLLRFEDISIDWELLRKSLQQVISILTQFAADNPELNTRLQNPEILNNLPDTVRECYHAHTQNSHPQETGDDLTGLVINLAFRPFLIHYSKGLIHLVDQNQWRRGYCPVCGGIPDFAFLDKERGSRWLLCSRCDAEWLFQRLECPYCRTRNSDLLSYYSDQDELYRVYVCDQCKYYLKAIDLRKTENEVILPLERYLTTDLDAQAYRNGYLAYHSIPENDGVNKQPKIS